MVKYKNWYLAGEPGMKDERKKLKLIILQCIAVITANFITIWYFEELFFRGFWYVIFASFILTFISVSYTHLDVYKRQAEELVEHLQNAGKNVNIAFWAI